MGNLGDTVIKFLGENVKQRYVVEAEDLFQLFSDMGILEDVDSLTVVLEHLENRNIDVNFKDNQNGYYAIYKSIENLYKFIKNTNINREKISNIMKKADNIKPPPDTSWMEFYRIDDEKELKPQTPVTETNPINMNQISDEVRLLQAMESRVNELHNIINNNQNGNI